jgi:predicted nuclease with TOPRIM domain
MNLKMMQEHVEVEAKLRRENRQIVADNNLLAEQIAILKAENKRLRETLESMHIDDLGWDLDNLDIETARAWHKSNNEKIDAAPNPTKGE